MSQHIIATINIVHPDWAPAQWVYILVAYALIAAASVPLLMVSHRHNPDSTLTNQPPRFLTILEQTNVVMIWVYKIAHIVVLSVRAKAGRRSAKYAFTHYEPEYSGWGNVWTFFIGFLPAAYVSVLVSRVADSSGQLCTRIRRGNDRGSTQARDQRSARFVVHDDAGLADPGLGLHPPSHLHHAVK